MGNSLKSQKTAASIGLYISYFFITIFFLGPLLWVLSLSLKTVPELFYAPPKFLPEHFSIENYSQVLWREDIMTYLKNSFLIEIGTITGTMLLIIPATYALSRFNFRGKHTVMFGILVFQMISPLVIVIPLYRYFSKLGLLNNYWSMIFVYIAINIPFSAWALKGYLDTIPMSIDEAGIIDGCSRMQVLIKLLLPLIMPGIVSVIILIFVRSWAQFIIPFILLNTNRMFPISVGLVNLQSTGDTISTHLLAAGCIIGIFPTVLIFIILQRFIVSALTSGAVKE
ncbi:carbohydrate ABC transporter permease [Treponema parvum]|uniref:carbohydrate ABC transporter permease n=1 Tax=Treponema parvum TaxID=138851 RepID=UPI001AEBAB87|nr:carbohydrate ABC transporter permease [Treponema parvum]QTQ15914.1 carbohydrate ABC transporter permease [Treponema parvum]